MAVQFDNNVSEWSRNTAADGKWLNKNTIQPLIARTEILRDAINDMTGTSVPELKAQLETEKQVRAEADNAEHEARTEADNTLRRDIDGLSEQIGDTINLKAGEGIKLEEEDSGRSLKISANYNDGDNTTYGIFTSSTGAGYNTGNWVLIPLSGNLTTDGISIKGLKDNKVYHIDISGYYVVNTPNDTIISAYLLDSNGKKLNFNVDTSNSGLAVPIILSYSFIPSTGFDETTETYTYKLEKWTSIDEYGQEGREAETNSINLFITDISIHELATKTISINVPTIKLYGFADNPTLAGSTLLDYRMLPISNANPMTGNVDIQVIDNSIKTKTTGIYNCNAVVDITKTGTLSEDVAITFKVPYSSTQDMFIDHIISKTATATTICLCWQAANCNHLDIKVSTLLFY